MQYKHNAALVSYAKDLRKSMTKEERHLWYDFLRSYSIRFYRQKVLGKYIADFYCAQAKLVIELDGSQHFENGGPDYDAKRTAFLQSYDIAVLRIPNNAVTQEFSAVCTYIDEQVKARLDSR